MRTDAGRIGFMQGRLSPLVDGKIQAFPWADWRQEFATAHKLGLGQMEWTLDDDRLFDNPLMTESGRCELLELARANAVRVGALTGDFLMQAPFWRASPDEFSARIERLDAVLDACASVGIRDIVVPLVDNGSVQSAEQAAVLHDVLMARAERLRAGGLIIAFESDFAPRPLADFIARYPADVFGINYDTGNSAALGYDPGEELAAYASRIVHVHIKDRVRGGTTVPLGTGNAELPRALKLLEGAGFTGDYILQTARAVDGDHAAALGRYRAMTLDWLGAA